MGKLLKIKAILITLIVGFLIGIILIIVMAVCGYKVGEAYINEQVNQMRLNSSVINNQLYVERYRDLLNKYLLDKGYVSLERLVFYLQHTNNVLDTSTLSYDVWDKAYLDNINLEEKQMIPIKTVCNKLKSDTSIPTFTIESGTNSNGVQIDVIDLCTIDGVDITTSSDYDEVYYPLPFTFPLKSNFTVTSIVFEHRNVDLGNISAEAQASTNYHSGWDLAVPTGTNFYSMCDGTVSNITNTQANDLPFKQSGNSIGNYMMVTCNNGFTAMYRHLQYRSQPFSIRKGTMVKKGELLGRTSTTGTSTGPHLHLGLKDPEGNLLDAIAYIDFTEYEGN